MNTDFIKNIDFTSPAVLIGAVVVILLIAVAIAVAVDLKKKRTVRLRQRFGAEYDYALSEAGSRNAAEEALNARVKRIEYLKIRDLTVAERERFLAEWEVLQSRFVDHPRGAVIEADELVNALLALRGYPAGGFEQRAADVSVSHAALVEPYRLAHAITGRAGRNEVTTEELRTAMIQYRTLFGALLETNTEKNATIEYRKLA
jgi:glycine/D-amino acid oxidase-like deaminating enzyme